MVRRRQMKNEVYHNSLSLCLSHRLRRSNSIYLCQSAQRLSGMQCGCMYNLNNHYRRTRRAVLQGEGSKETL